MPQGGKGTVNKEAKAPTKETKKRGPGEITGGYEGNTACKNLLADIHRCC